MKITLRTFADFRQIVGSKEAKIDLRDGETVAGLLDALCRVHSGLKKKLFEKEELKPFVIVLKNGRNISSLQGIDTVIADGDVVSLFPPVAGG